LGQVEEVVSSFFFTFAFFPKRDLRRRSAKILFCSLIAMHVGNDLPGTRLTFDKRKAA
jgi:hypothetical protein